MNHRVTFKGWYVTIEAEKRKTKQRGDFMNTQKTGEFIKNLRKENNMTQLELAKKLNCTDKAVSRWETGKGLPDADTLLSLSDVFVVSINEILLGERFNLQVNHSEYPAVAESVPIVEEIISTADETIVEILKEKEEIVKAKRSDIIVVIACCLQAINLFVMPRVYPSDNLLIYGSMASFVLVGLIKSKSKWVYPLVNVACLLLWLPTTGSDHHVYVSFAIIYGTLSAGVIGAIEVVRYIIKKIKQ